MLLQCKYLEIELSIGSVWEADVYLEGGYIQTTKLFDLNHFCFETEYLVYSLDRYVKI